MDGHLKFKEMKWFEGLPLISFVLISWGIAFIEYCIQVPANRIGFVLLVFAVYFIFKK